MFRWGFFHLALFAASLQASLPHGAVEETSVSPAKRFSLDLYSWAYTNPLGEWNGRTATVEGATGSPFQVFNQLTLHTPAFWRFDYEVTAQVVLQPYQGQRVQLQDPSVGLEGYLFSSPFFTYWARYDVLIPVTPGSAAEGILATPQAMQSLEFQLPRSAWRLEVSFIPQLKLFHSGLAATNTYLSPRLFYALSEAFAWMAIAEVGLESKSETGLLNLQQTGNASVGAGCRYKSGGGTGLWVQPFLNFYPAGKLATNAHLGVFFGGPLL